MTSAAEDEFVTIDLPLRLRPAELKRILRLATRGRAKSKFVPSSSTTDLASKRELADHMLRMRRYREIELGSALFADPAWDMMLDLFVRHVDGKVTSVSSACLGSAAPQTTALRYLQALLSDGLVEKMPCPDDHRVQCVRLSKDGVARMCRLLEHGEKLLAARDVR